MARAEQIGFDRAVYEGDFLYQHAPEALSPQDGETVKGVFVSDFGLRKSSEFANNNHSF